MRRKTQRQSKPRRVWHEPKFFVLCVLVVCCVSAMCCEVVCVYVSVSCVWCVCGVCGVYCRSSVWCVVCCYSWLDLERGRILLPGHEKIKFAFDS